MQKPGVWFHHLLATWIDCSLFYLSSSISCIKSSSSNKAMRSKAVLLCWLFGKLFSLLRKFSGMSGISSFSGGGNWYVVFSWTSLVPCSTPPPAPSSWESCFCSSDMLILGTRMQKGSTKQYSKSALLNECATINNQYSIRQCDIFIKYKDLCNDRSTVFNTNMSKHVHCFFEHLSFNGLVKDELIKWVISVTIYKKEPLKGVKVK